MFDIRNIDLPRKVKFRERYKKPEFKVDKGCRIDRNYKNFCEFLEKNPDIRQKKQKIKLHFGYKSGFCLSKTAFQVLKWRFVYKYSIVNYKYGILIYKVASRLTCE